MTTGTLHVRLLKIGRSQVICVPREFELPGNEVILRRDDSGRLILEPVVGTELLDLLNSWGPLSENEALPEIPDLPPEPVSL